MEPISDMLARIRNAQAVKHETADLPYSNLKWELAKVFSKLGFVGEVEKVGRKEKRLIRVTLKYVDREPAIRILKAISRPGRRVYIKKNKIFPKKFGRMLIISTPKGILVDREAKKLGLGGEVICEIM